MTQSPTRTEAACLKAERIAPYFTAWRLPEGRTSGEATRLDTKGAETLDDAIANALTAGECVNHKDTLIVRASDRRTGKTMVHFYAIKRRSTPAYVWDDDLQRHKREFRHYPAELFVMAANDFTPVEPWKWEPGSDPVGIDRQEVRQ